MVGLWRRKEKRKVRPLQILHFLPLLSLKKREREERRGGRKQSTISKQRRTIRDGEEEREREEEKKIRCKHSFSLLRMKEEEGCFAGPSFLPPFVRMHGNQEGEEEEERGETKTEEEEEEEEEEKKEEEKKEEEETTEVVAAQPCRAPPLPLLSLSLSISFPFFWWGRRVSEVGGPSFSIYPSASVSRLPPLSIIPRTPKRLNASSSSSSSLARTCTHPPTHTHTDVTLCRQVGKSLPVSQEILL